MNQVLNGALVGIDMEIVSSVLVVGLPIIVTYFIFFRKPKKELAERDRFEPSHKPDSSDELEVAWSQADVQDNSFGRLFWNAFTLRCPVCKRGRLFRGWFAMVTECPVCKVRFDHEPGYFFGSIYFNYGATGVLEIIMFLIGRFVINVSGYWLEFFLVVFAIVFPMWFFRYARSSWMVWDQYYSPRKPGDAAHVMDTERD